MSSILVTGGAGYIGSHVTKELLRLGHEPVVYDDLRSGHQNGVRNAIFVEGDLFDSERLRKTIEAFRIESVMHFAADSLVGESVKNPVKYFNNNVKNSIQLIEIMCELFVKKIIFSSSAAVYGEPKEVPIQEGHPCNPTNPYGETKLIFERVLEAFHEEGKIDYTSLRYFNAAGADPEGSLGEDHSPETHLIPIGLSAAISGEAVLIFGSDYDTPDGTCIRDYIHVTDLAQAHVLALESLDRGGDSGVFNLGNGQGYSVKETIEMIRKVTGRDVRTTHSGRRPGDPARLVASSERIRLVLGWNPRYPDLETIIRTAWDWHRDHPKGYKS